MKKIVILFTIIITGFLSCTDLDPVVYTEIVYDNFFKMFLSLIHLLFRKVTCLNHVHELRYSVLLSRNFKMAYRF